DIHSLVSSGNLFYPFLEFLLFLRVYSSNISNEFIPKKRKRLSSRIYYLGLFLINGKTQFFLQIFGDTSHYAFRTFLTFAQNNEIIRKPDDTMSTFRHQLVQLM